MNWGKIALVQIWICFSKWQWCVWVSWSGGKHIQRFGNVLPVNYRIQMYAMATLERIVQTNAQHPGERDLLSGRWKATKYQKWLEMKFKEEGWHQPGQMSSRNALQREAQVSLLIIKIKMYVNNTVNHHTWIWADCERGWLLCTVTFAHWRDGNLSLMEGLMLLNGRQRAQPQHPIRISK